MITRYFMEYIRSVENAAKKGYNEKTGRWYSIGSPEGGWEIGYGHKLTEKEAKEVNKTGLTDKAVEEQLGQDLLSHAKKAKEIMGKYHGQEVWDKLPPQVKEMATDFAFNGVLKKFPKFRQALIDRDLETVKKEYKRYYKTPDGVKHELKDRNEQFYKRYLEKPASFWLKPCSPGPQ